MTEATKKTKATPKAAAKSTAKAQPKAEKVEKPTKKAAQVKKPEATKPATAKKNPEARANKQRRNSRRRQMTVKELSAPRVSTKLQSVALRSYVADDLPSMTVPFRYATTFMHKFLSNRGDKVMQVAERLAATMRLLTSEKELYEDFKRWSEDSMSEAEAELNTITEQRKLLEETLREGQREISVNIPTKFEATFTFTTPIGNRIVALLRDIDDELAHAQRLYFAGAMNDLELAEANRQGLAVINSYMDRAFKITSPGKRETGRFQASSLAAVMRGGQTEEVEQVEAAKAEEA